LFAIGDDVQASGNLVVDSNRNGVIEQLRQIVGAEFIEAA
jgi:hypothetical protein